MISGPDDDHPEDRDDIPPAPSPIILALFIVVAVLWMVAFFTALILSPPNWGVLPAAQ